MASKNSSEEPPFNSLLESYLGTPTETIALNSPLPEQLTESGSFDLRGFRLTSVGRLLKAVPIPVLLVDSLFSIVFVNESTRKLDDDPSRIQGMTFSSLFPRLQDAAKFQGIVRKVFLERKLQVGEGLVEVGANRLWGRVNLRPVRIGSSRFVLVLIEDLTLEKKHRLVVETQKERIRHAKEHFEKQVLVQTAELKAINERLREKIKERNRVQKALEKSRESFCNIVERMPDGLAVLDSDGIVLYANPTAAQFLGRLSESLVGERLCVEPGAGRFMELKISRLNGELGTAEMCLSLTQWNGKEAFLAILHDITDRKRTEMELLRAQKLDSLELITGGLAHDFNNLLTANVANISLAKIRATPESPIYDVLTKAEKAALKAKDLIKQLLTFTKGRSPTKRLTSLATLLQESVALSFSGSNVQCSLKIADDLWATEVEPSQIGMVFQNLLINAQQAMPSGGSVMVKAENILVRAEPQGDEWAKIAGRYVKVTVTDTGSGISRENLSKIFEPYFTTKTKGSGLGLATSYGVIRGHGGRIDVESRVGEGTSFCVFLPASERPSMVVESAEGLPMGGKGRVLVMDDEQDIREVACDLLTLMGYQVETVENGAQAIEKYETAMIVGRPFDVVIMDLTVRGEMGGQEAIQNLLKIDPAAKVLLCTGHVDGPIMRDYQRYGFSGAIAKPYNAVELGEALHRAILLQEIP